MKKRKIIWIIIIVLVICIFLFQNLKNQNKSFQDDIIFFKSFILGTNRKTDNSNNNTNFNQEKTPVQYRFNVSYKNTDFKNIDLSNTIDKDTLINNKIAPRNFRKIRNNLRNKSKDKL